MAKDRATKPHKEGVKKREKKVSRDGVDKHKKDKKDKKKSKRAVTPSSSDDDSVNSGAPVVEPEVKETKQKKKAGKDGKNEVEADATSLFAIDTNPTPVDPSAVEAAAASGSDSGSEDGGVEAKPKKQKQKGSKNVPAPSGLNRAARRRIKLIERQREVIRKKLGVPEGSQERADEVQRELDEWTERYDEKAAIRAKKQKARREKEAARVKNKRGKVLTGRKLKERNKGLATIEKKAAKKQGKK